MPGYEIDFLALESLSKSGDAICLRFGELLGWNRYQRVVVVDGGHRSDGPSVIEHLQRYYCSGLLEIPYIDLLVSTHPDGDHIGGLQHIVEHASVGELWIHQPWLHASSLKKYLDDRFTASGTKSRLKKDLDSAVELVRVAQQRGVVVREPFQGVTGLGGAVTVLGPERHFYEKQVATFRLGGATLPALPNPGLMYENYRVETLDQGGGTSPMNETSVVLWVQPPSAPGLLLTGDAGVLGLTDAVIYAYRRHLRLWGASVVQIPHHGSRRNVSPQLLDAMLGPPAGVWHQPTRHAVVSCATNGAPKHPSDRVLNAFIRRGCSTLMTAGGSIQISQNAPVRANFAAVAGRELKYLVEG